MSEVETTILIVPGGGVFLAGSSGSLTVPAWIGGGRCLAKALRNPDLVFMAPGSSGFGALSAWCKSLGFAPAVVRWLCPFRSPSLVRRTETRAESPDGILSRVVRPTPAGGTR